MATESARSRYTPQNAACPLHALHLRVLNGDQTAREQLCAILLERARCRLRRTFWTIEPTLIDDGIEDALMHYLKDPAAYNPRRSALDDWIALTARCRILDALRKQVARLRNEAPIPNDLPAELHVQRARGPEDENYPLKKAVLLASAADEREREYLLAKLRGERDTARLAALLGKDHLSSGDRRDAVKRLWDCLRIRAVRRWKRLLATGNIPWTTSNPDMLNIEKSVVALRRLARISDRSGARTSDRSLSGTD
jgi:DNA-directed RNA polymerase specialized sigma24 family protein